MKYQDIKVRETAKLAASSIVCAASSLFLWVRPDVADIVASVWQPRAGGGGTSIVIILGGAAVVFLGFVIWNLLTSPAQDEKLIRSREAKGKRPMGRFDSSLLDRDDPHFLTSTISYISKQGRRTNR